MTVTDEFSEIVPEYAELKGNIKTLTDKEKKLNGKLKEMMQEADLTSVEAGGYKLTYNVTEKQTMDEDKLLAIIKTGDKYPELIKTKEYIDMDVLESMLYNEKIDEDTMHQISTCVTTKQIETIRVTKAKKKVKDDE